MPRQVVKERGQAPPSGRGSRDGRRHSHRSSKRKPGGARGTGRQGVGVGPCEGECPAALPSDRDFIALAGKGGESPFSGPRNRLLEGSACT